MMRRSDVKGKCGLLALVRPMDAEEQRQLRTGRVPWYSLGITTMT